MAKTPYALQHRVAPRAEPNNLSKAIKRIKLDPGAMTMEDIMGLTLNLILDSPDDLDGLAVRQKNKLDAIRLLAEIKIAQSGAEDDEDATLAKMLKDKQRGYVAPAEDADGTEEVAEGKACSPSRSRKPC